MDTRQFIARFEAERQALAMMDHPNIARVLDAGCTDTGRPYFVMELVKGIPITRFCDENRLTTRQRLELLVSVCQAVQHAHQKGIIHRDLKPSNVLVASYDDRPVPKIIDFGVAKTTNQPLTEKTLFTQIGQILGTLEYMSPEQAVLNQLDVDTRSDVYSLGVILYELLTGVTPVDSGRLRSAALDETLRIIFLIVAEYDIDGDPTTLSDMELANIRTIWETVVEDFALFNVDITTVEPAVLAPGRPIADANEIALRIAIGPEVKVYKYANAATRTSGTQNATSSFKLTSSFSLASDDRDPKGIVTDGTSIWVVNDSPYPDRVFKYTLTGQFLGSWLIDAHNAKPTGLTINPAAPSSIWIVDSGTKSVYQYPNAISTTSGVRNAFAVFPLAAGNTNPQGIADPPAPGSLLATETPVLAEPVSAEAALRGNDAALENMYYEPPKKVRIDTVRRSESRVVESSTRDLSYTVGASANRLAIDSKASDKHHTEVDDLFAQWESDPLELVSLPDLGM